MGIKTQLHKQVFNKDEFKKTVNTEFSQLVNIPDPTFFDLNLATVDDFFNLYDKLFFEIPKIGEDNSHEFLAKTSLEYSGIELLNEQIQALLEEISALREENLDIRQQLIDALTKDATSDIPPQLIGKTVQAQVASFSPIPEGQSIADFIRQTK